MHPRSWVTASRWLDRAHQRDADQLRCRGGREPGQVLASLPTGSPATTFSFDVPTGVYYVRVHALSASGRSFASNEIRISVNMPQLPSSPADLLGLANGSNLLLSWRTTYAGGPPASHVLDVSGAATLSVPVPRARRSRTPVFLGEPTRLRCAR